MHVHVCVHMSRDTPHAPRCLPPIYPFPELQGAWITESLPDNSILFEKSLPLNIPEFI